MSVLAAVGIAASVAGSLGGMFGGGGDDSAKKAQQAIANAAAKARNGAQPYIDQGSEFLKTYMTKSNAAISPQTFGSYNALDNYFDALGIARPKVGSAKVAAALDFASTYKHVSPLDRLLKGFASREAGTVTDSTVPGSVRDMLDPESGTTVQEKLDFLTKWRGETKDAWQIYADNDGTRAFRRDEYEYLKAGLDKYKGETPENPEHVAMLELAKKYREGDLETMKADPDDVVNMLAATPGYQFARTEGTNKIESSAAATGMLQSGRTMKDINKFGTGLADQTYQSYINNLAGAAGMTAPFAGQTGNNAYNTGTALNANSLYNAELIANSHLGQGSSLANLYSGQAAQKSAQQQSMSSGLMGLGGKLLGGIFK